MEKFLVAIAILCNLSLSGVVMFSGVYTPGFVYVAWLIANVMMLRDLIKFVESGEFWL